MKVTVCEWPDPPAPQDWERLAEHVRTQRSELVVLPEAPFCAWFAGRRSFNPGVWAAAVTAHDQWEQRALELAPASIITTRPMDFGNERYDEAVIIEHGRIRSLHAKSRLSHQAGSWERAWYQPATADFVSANVGGARVGALLGEELWLQDQAQLYAETATDILVTPRASRAGHFSRWLAAARRAALRARAFSLSSNRVGTAAGFDGHGWAVGPAGQILALTHAEEPIVSLTLDLVASRRARAQAQHRVPATGTAPAVLPGREGTGVSDPAAVVASSDFPG